MEEADAAKPAGQLALARLRQGARIGLLTDACATDAFPRAVLGALRAGGRRLMTAAGEIRFQPAPGLAALSLPALLGEVGRCAADGTPHTLMLLHA